MSNVSYEPINWEDSPSRNTPINATNLNHMEEGISNSANRASASVEYDDLLSLEECSAVTEEGKYAADAMAVKELNDSLNKYSSVRMLSTRISFTSGKTATYTFDISEYGYKKPPIAILNGQWCTGNCENITTTSVGVILCAHNTCTGTIYVYLFEQP